MALQILCFAALIGFGIRCSKLGLQYRSQYPSHLNSDDYNATDWVKARTIELYDYLPQTSLEDRFKFTGIRDEVIHLNYKYFGYVASGTYVADPGIGYEDKFQSCLMGFCKMWHKYRFAKKYRTDLSFATFFKPRLSEEIQRELNPVKYSTERSLKMKAAKQLGKHWAKLTYDDLKLVTMPEDELSSLEAIFGVVYPANLEDHDPFIADESNIESQDIMQLYSDNYNTVVELLMHTMVELESLISDKELLKIAEIQCISFETLKELRPKAEELLKRKLEAACDIQDCFYE